MEQLSTQPQQSVDNDAYCLQADTDESKSLRDHPADTRITVVSCSPQVTEATRVQRRQNRGRIVAEILCASALLAVAMGTVSNLMEIRALHFQLLSQQHHREARELAEFVLDLTNATSCHGNQRSNRHPCLMGNQYLTFGRLGQLRQLDPGTTANFALTSDREEILVRRDGVYSIDARARVRFSSGYEHLSGGVNINGSLSRRLICAEADSKILACEVNSFVRLKAGDRISLALLMFSRQELLVTESVTYFRILS